MNTPHECQATRELEAMRRHIIAMSRLLVDDGHMTPAGARQMKNATDMHKLDSIKQSSSEIKNENEIANFDDQN